MLKSLHWVAKSRSRFSVRIGILITKYRSFWQVTNISCCCRICPFRPIIPERFPWKQLSHRALLLSAREKWNDKVGLQKPNTLTSLQISESGLNTLLLPALLPSFRKFETTPCDRALCLRRNLFTIVIGLQFYSQSKLTFFACIADPSPGPFPPALPTLWGANFSSLCGTLSSPPAPPPPFRDRLPSLPRIHIPETSIEHWFTSGQGVHDISILVDHNQSTEVRCRAGGEWWRRAASERGLPARGRLRARSSGAPSQRPRGASSSRLDERTWEAPPPRAFLRCCCCCWRLLLLLPSTSQTPITSCRPSRNVVEKEKCDVGN